MYIIHVKRLVSVYIYIYIYIHIYIIVVYYFDCHVLGLLFCGKLERNYYGDANFRRHSSSGLDARGSF